MTTTLVSSALSSTLTFTLCDAHLKEWQNSGVSNEIIHLNVETIYDSSKVDRLLNRNSKKRWKHSDNLIPCWAVYGVDPLSGETTLQGVQVKPDVPPVVDGKTLKYIGASQYATAPLFLNTGYEGYWKNIIDNILEPIILTEGGKKAGAGLTIGFPTISIPGVSTCRRNGRLHQNLQLFTGVGRTTHLCFDNDILHKKPVQDALFGLGKELAAKGCKVMVIILPAGPEKGMDDYIFVHGEEKFRELVRDALTFEEWILESGKLIAEQQETQFNSRLANVFALINKTWGDNLRYNSLKQTIELNGRPMDVNHIKLIIALEFDIDISKEDAFTIIEWIAKSNTYSPIVEYLNEVESKFPEIEHTFLDNLAQQFFGTKDPIHALYLKNFLVASVARARTPGCWMDCALILTGEQGIGKSRFWLKLFGEDWFTDDLGNDKDKDEKMKMHRFWGLEWGEFETVYRRKDVEELKRFLATKSETYRTPYDRKPEEYKRGFVFTGTSNQQEILNDPTGSRRFWIIPANGDIPVRLVETNRDKIWAAANALYKSGYDYRLTKEQDRERAEHNQSFQIEHPWKELIAKFISAREYVSVQDIYQELNIEPARQDNKNKMEISRILRTLGWKPEKRRVDGIAKNVWIEDKDQNKKPSEQSEQTQNPIFESIATQDLEGVPTTVPLEEGKQNDTSGFSVPLEENNQINRNSSEQPKPLINNNSVKSVPAVPAVPTVFENNPLEKTEQSWNFTVSTDWGEVNCDIVKLSTPKNNYALTITAEGYSEETQFFCGRPGELDFRKQIDGLKLFKNFEVHQRKIWEAIVLERNRKFSVRQLGEDDYIWVDDCILTRIPDYPKNSFFEFKTPDGGIITVGSTEEFKVFKM